MKTAYYAICKGRRIGVVDSLKRCQSYTNDFPGAYFKEFANKQDAIDFVHEHADKTVRPVEPTGYAYIKGIFDKDHNIAGWAGFIIDGNGNRHEIADFTANPKQTSPKSYTVAVLLGTIQATSMASLYGMKNLTVYYEYPLVKNLITNQCESHMIHTWSYTCAMRKLMADVNVRFLPAKDHFMLHETNAYMENAAVVCQNAAKTQAHRA